jgi:hypothetical protein
MPWQWEWNKSVTCYSGEEYKEILRKKYGLPDDWQPDEGEPMEWSQTILEPDDPGYDNPGYDG